MVPIDMAPIDTPSRHVWVLRHAKAAAESPGGDDHGRPLTKRGRRQAQEAARFLAVAREEGRAVPLLVISSSAARALETAEIVKGGLGPDVELDVERALYSADEEEVMDVIRRVDDDVPSVMVVGHNPTFANLALWLVSRTDPRRSILESFPTCALAQIGARISRWSELSAGTGTLEEHFVPER